MFTFRGPDGSTAQLASFDPSQYQQFQGMGITQTGGPDVSNATGPMTDYPGATPGYAQEDPQQYLPAPTDLGIGGRMAQESPQQSGPMGQWMMAQESPQQSGPMGTDGLAQESPQQSGPMSGGPIPGPLSPQWGPYGDTPPASWASIYDPHFYDSIMQPPQAPDWWPYIQQNYPEVNLATDYSPPSAGSGGGDLYGAATGSSLQQLLSGNRPY